MNYEVNPLIWFADREMSYPPMHFTTATTQVTIESKQWVLDHLIGRFSITPGTGDLFNLENIGIISFEDPKEAMLFELKWS